VGIPIKREIGKIKRKKGKNDLAMNSSWKTESFYHRHNQRVEKKMLDRVSEKRKGQPVKRGGTW